MQLLPASIMQRKPADGASPQGSGAAWAIVAGAFVVDLIGFGAIYSHAAFADQIASTFAVRRSSVTTVFALGAASCFFVGALSGPLADRIGARWQAFAGMLTVALGLIVAARAENLLQLHLGYGLLVGIGAGLAHVPAMAAVQRNFVRRRGLASGIATCGVGVGIVLVPPLSNLLLETGSWQSAFVICGVLAALAGSGAALMLPGGTAAAADRGRDIAPCPARGRLPSPLIIVYAGTLLVSLAATLPYVLLVGTARDLGIPRYEAVALIGYIGVGTLVGRLLLAATADAIGRREMFIACCAGIACSMVVWATAADRLTLEVFAFGFGALQGGFVSLLPAFVTDLFGTRSIGRTLGILLTGRGIALLCAPPAVVAGMDAFGTIAAPLILVAALVAAGTLLLAVRSGAPAAGVAGPMTARWAGRVDDTEPLHVRAGDRSSPKAPIPVVQENGQWPRWRDLSGWVPAARPPQVRPPPCESGASRRAVQHP